MANNRSIKDFYIQIGVDFDDSKVKQFEQTMKNVVDQVDDFADSLDNVSESARKTESSVSRSFNSIFSITKRATFGIVGLGTASVFAGKKISQSLIDINNLADQSGTTVQQIELLRRQFEQAGGSAGEADAFIGGLAERLARLKVLGGDAGVFLPQIFQGVEDIGDPVAAIQRIREFLLQASREQRLLVAQELNLSSAALGLLTRPESEFQDIRDRARATANIDDEYLVNARRFNAEFAALQSEFRRIQLDLFAGVSEELKGVVKELRDFLADEDIKTIIIETVKKVSDLFQLLVKGLGGILDRVSVAGQQLGEGESAAALRTLVVGTPAQVTQRERNRLSSLTNQQLIKRLNVNTGDLQSPLFNAFADELESRGVFGQDINLPASLQRLTGLAPSEEEVQRAITNRQQTNNINVTNNFNSTTTTGTESRILTNQLKQSIATNTREDIN